MESRFISELRWNSHNTLESKWQRRMGVEPTRDRAERPLSRFEDGETHRGPYTSMLMDVFCHSHPALSSGTLPGQASVRMRSTSTSVRSLTVNSALRKPGRSRLP